MNRLFHSGALACALLALPCLASDSSSSAAPASSGPAPTEKVLGIGGLFVRSKDPKALAKWYEKNLGVTRAITSYWDQVGGHTIFQPFPEKTDYIGPPDKQWMINFRVANLDAMVRQLQAANIEVKVDPATYPNGRFAHLKDPDGNTVELWEEATPTPAPKTAQDTGNKSP